MSDKSIGQEIADRLNEYADALENVVHTNTTVLKPSIREWEILRKMFLDVLSKEQEKRPEKSKWLDTGELEWMAYEREVMLDVTNITRRWYKLPPVTMEDIMRVEQQAIGYTDYTRKFALYCAELAVGQNRSCYG